MFPATSLPRLRLGEGVSMETELPDSKRRVDRVRHGGAAAASGWTTWSARVTSATRATRAACASCRASWRRGRGAMASRAAARARPGAEWLPCKRWLFWFRKQQPPHTARFAKWLGQHRHPPRQQCSRHSQLHAELHAPLARHQRPQRGAMTPGGLCGCRSIHRKTPLGQPRSQKGARMPP